MAQQVERHNIAEGLYVYKQANSKRWYSRFVLDGTWYAKATKEKELDAAIVKAIQLQTEYRIMLSNNVPVHKSKKTKKHTFAAIMKLAVQRMDDELEQGKGKVIYKDYKGVLNMYHKEYFGDMNIREAINPTTIVDFDEWRTKKMGRTPAKSTVLTHNSAFQRVLDEAVIQKIITASELPALKNTGESGKRRAAFTSAEYKKILKKAKSWIGEGRKKVTRDIREQLYYYMQLAIYTGLRPGTEIDQLTWGDVGEKDINGKFYYTITVRKGKTTKHTGTREIVCKDEVSQVMANLLRLAQEKHNDNHYDPSDNELLFEGTKEFTVNFRKILDELKLKTNAHGERTLYSLRHSYITWELEAGTPTSVIATQCGTSEDMIEQHYKHIVPSMFAHQLSGRA